MAESADVVKRSVVLPAYNESEYISEMVDRVVRVMEKRDDSYEIIVVDNCSTDNTAAIVDDIHELNPRVRVIRHEVNRLYAGSCLTGAKQSVGERVFIMDSDGQIDPDEVWRFDEQLDRGNDIVFGRRVERDDPKGRLLISKIFWLHARILIDYRLGDVNTGIRAFDRKFADALELNYRVNLVNPEMYVRARNGGFTIGQSDIRQHERQGGVSSHQFSKFWDIEKTVVKYLWSLRKEMRAAKSRRS